MTNITDRGRTSLARPVPGEALLHPVALMALGLLIVNDHVLKYSWPGPVTGKLSDFAGLVVFPLLLHGLWQLATERRPPKSGDRRERADAIASYGAVMLTGLGFAAVKLGTPLTDLYRTLIGFLQWGPGAAASLVSGDATPPMRPVAVVTDPTDLIALGALPVAIWLVMKGRTRRADASCGAAPADGEGTDGAAEDAAARRRR